MRDALIVFAKQPVPGQTKTRLNSILSPEHSAKLYDAFVKDSLQDYSQLQCDLRLYIDGAEKDVPEDWIHSGMQIYKQRGDDLGDRMLNAFSETFVSGAERVVIVGTDHPSLPKAYLELAFDLLQTPLSICIGPSRDGGYYALGMNECFAVLFNGMTYSHDQVFAQTMQRAAAASENVTVLPEWYDVDTPESLAWLLEDMKDERFKLTFTNAILKEVGIG